MKFLIMTADYPEFLDWHYRLHPWLKNQPYDEQHRLRDESLSGDIYADVSNLRKLGHEAWDVYATNEFMQKIGPVSMR